MPYGQQNDVQDLVNLYRQRPDLFDDNQVLELERKARDLNITFKPLRDNFSLEKVVGQLTTGFVEGMTTFPVGEKPTTTYESIAHSLGHLAGFAPSILSLPVKGAAKLIGATGAKQLAKIVNRRGNKTVQFFDQVSVPMMFSRGGTKLVNKGLERLGANSVDFLRRGSVTRNMADHAVGLASASAISNVWQGYDGMYDGFVHGAIAGGAFGGVGNFIRLNNIFKNGNPAQVRRAEDVLKAGVGASITGLPSTLRDDPIEMQIYEYLLGGFFGYKSRPAHEAEGGKYWQSLKYHDKGTYAFRPETHPDWNKYSKKAQDYVNKGSVEESWKYIQRRGIEDSGTPPEVMRKWIEQRAEVRKKTPDEMAQEEAADYYNSKFRYVSNANIENSKVDIEVDMDNPLDHSEIKENIIKKHREDTPNKDIYVFETDEMGEVTEMKRVHADYYGNRLTQSYQDKPANKLDGGHDYIELTNVYSYTKKVDKQNRTVYKPLDTRTKNVQEDKKWVGKVFSKIPNESLFPLQEKLHSQGKYIFGGVKDKGVFNVRDYHIDSERISLHDVINALSANSPERSNGKTITSEDIGKSFSKSQKAEHEWLSSKLKSYNVSDIERMHERAWKSNVLVEAERNGYYTAGGSLENIHKIMTKGHSKNVIDWNKREQLYHDKSLPLKYQHIKSYLTKLNKRTLSSAVYKDPVYEFYKDSKGENVPWNSDIDGTVVFRPSLFEEIRASIGYPEGINMNKPVIVMQLKGGGTLAVKSAGYKAEDSAFDKPMLDYMRANKLDVLMFSSATKHLGSEIKTNNFIDSNLAKGEYKHKETELNKFELTPESIRMNLGTFQNPQRSMSTHIVKQLFGVLNEQQAKGITDHVFNTIYEPSIRGLDRKGNLRLDNKNATEFLKTGNKSLLENIKVDNLDVKIIHEVFRTNKENHQKLAQTLAKQILKIEKEGKGYEDERVDLGATDYSEYTNRNKLLMELTEGSQSARESFKPTRKFWENSYRKYITNRYLKPKYKYSGKTWLAPKLPHMRYHNEVKVGELILDNGFEKMPVKVKGLDNINNLGQLWKAYQNFLNKGSKADIAKRKRDKPDKLKAFEEALELAFIRVPADSMGGVRILKFKGFSGKKGLSAYTNAKDNSYIGGADKDSDSAFFYQGFDAKTKKAYRDQQNEWEKDGKFIDSKSKKFDKLFEAEISEEYSNIESKFSPSFRKQVAANARKGQQGLGVGVSAKNKMLSLYDYVTSQGGDLTVPWEIVKKDGKTIKAKLRIKTKKDGDVWIRTLGREIVNRSADSPDYSKMLDYSRFADILMNKGFDVTLDWGRGKPQKVDTFNTLNRTPLKDAGDILSIIDSHPKQSGLALNLDMFQYKLETTRNNGRFKNIAALISDAMIRDNIHKSISVRALENYIDMINLGKELFKPSNMTPKERAFYKKLTRAQNIDLGSKTLDTLIKELSKDEADLSKIDLSSETSLGKLRDFISNDIYKIASHRALARKGMEIYRQLEKEGYEKPEEILDQLLKPIATRASDIKNIFRNINVPDNMTDVTLPIYDSMVMTYKKFNIGKVVEANKKNGIKINQELLEDYFDMWLTSPFSYVGKKPRGYYSLATPFGSRAISSRAKKAILNEFDDLYNKVRQKETIVKEDILLPFKPTIEKSTVQKAEEITSLVMHELIRKEFNPKENFARKAVVEEQIKVVKEFEKNLKDMPRWTKDFEDMFINWQLEMGNTIPKVAADITVEDMAALNRFWFDLKKNPADPAIQRLYYYADKRTIDKKAQAFDIKHYVKYTMPVRSGDTFVKKTIKRGFSTLGIMREFFNKVLYLENSSLDIQNVKIKNEFRLLESMGVKDANTINDLVATRRKMRQELREGEFDTNEGYLAIKDKIYKVDGKDYKGSELIEIADKAYTDYFKTFGDKWIYSNVDWTKPVKGQKLNPYLHWNKNGKFDINNFIRRTVEGIHGGEKVSIPLETILRFQYEYSLENLISSKTKNGKIEWGKSLVTPEKFRELYRKKVPFKPIGKFKPEEYFPQMNHNVKKLETWRLQESQRFYDEAIANGKSEKAAVKAAMGRYEAISYAIEKSKSNTPFADEAMDTMIEMGNMHSKSVSDILEKQGNIGFFNKSGNLLPREMNMPFYDTTTDAVYNYMDSIVRSHYKNLGAVMANYRIDDMLKRKPFPKFTDKQYKLYNPKAEKDPKTGNMLNENFRDWNDVWADYLRFYVRDSFGHKSTFPERIINSMSEGDPLKLKKNLYYGTSDQAIINAVEKLRVAHEKKFKMPLPFLGNVPKDKAQRAEFYQRWIHKMGSMEARYELMTLLANSGVMVGNLYGGSTLNIASTGLRNFTRAIDMKYLSKNVLNDAKGNPLYFYKNPSTGKKTPVQTRKDLYAWMAEKGVIDNFLQYELQLNTNLRGKGKNVGEFMKELGKLWKKNPEVSDETVLSLAKKYKVQDTMLKYGGWFMQKSERILRLNAFMSHALQARDAYGKYAKDLKLDDPYILEFGLRGIETTQFLYHSPNRPAFMRTAMGKVLSRFKLFVFNSARVRKEMYKQAKYYGFKEGTEQFERFKDLMFIDLMTFALGSMFAYSLFDTALPPPWDFLQETSEWLFGDRRERERAFFGQYPYPIAPLNYVTPPIARIPLAFASVLNGDHEKFLDYHIHTMYPFGRIYRQFDQTFDEPYGTTFGRGMQQFFRLPTDKLKTRIKKARIDEERRKRISYTLGE